jgi:hypothetical protein
MSVRRKRAFALAIVVILVGAVLATPAQAHFTASISHIIDHAKKVFYTKSQSDSRYVNVGEKAANADKLDGLDSTAFLPADAQAVDSDRLDEFDSSDFLLTNDAVNFAKKLGNVVTVSPSGGDFDSIQGAVDSITDADGSNPYLVLVGPGNYSERVTLTDGINLQGSGASLTRITTQGADDCADGYVVKAALRSEISDLTLSGSGGDCAVGVLNPGHPGSAVLLHDLSILVDSVAITGIGILNQGGLISLDRVSTEIYALQDGGVAVGIDQTNNAHLVMTRSAANAAQADSATYGIRNNASGAFIEDSSLTAGLADTRLAMLNENGSGQSVTIKRSSTLGISSGANYFVTVSLSNVDGPVTGGTSTCTGNVDGSMQWLETTCPS